MSHSQNGRSNRYCIDCAVSRHQDLYLCLIYNPFTRPCVRTKFTEFILQDEEAVLWDQGREIVRTHCITTYSSFDGWVSQRQIDILCTIHPLGKNCMYIDAESTFPKTWDKGAACMGEGVKSSTTSVFCILTETERNMPICPVIMPTHGMYSYSPAFFELQAIILILSVVTVSVSNLNVAFFKMKVHTSSHER